MPVIFQHRIYRTDLQRNPQVLYLFGDNLLRIGYGGQAAEMRDEPNAVGVATKKAPGMGSKDFFTDDEYLENIEIIHDDLKRARDHLIAGGIVVVPSDGLGTGLSELPKRAPSTNRYLVARLSELALLGPDELPPYEGH